MDSDIGQQQEYLEFLQAYRLELQPPLEAQAQAKLVDLFDTQILHKIDEIIL